MLEVKGLWKSPPFCNWIPAELCHYINVFSDVYVLELGVLDLSECLSRVLLTNCSVEKMWSSYCSWAVLLLWLWQLHAGIFSEMHNFAIIVIQSWAPPSPPFSACFKTVTSVTFSLLFVTAGLSLSCSSTVELEGVSHHHLMFSIFNVTFYHQPAGAT